MIRIFLKTFFRLAERDQLLAVIFNFLSPFSFLSLFLVVVMKKALIGGGVGEVNENRDSKSASMTH